MYRAKGNSPPFILSLFVPAVVQRSSSSCTILPRLGTPLAARLRPCFPFARALTSMDEGGRQGGLVRKNVTVRSAACKETGRKETGRLWLLFLRTSSGTCSGTCSGLGLVP